MLRHGFKDVEDDEELEEISAKELLLSALEISEPKQLFMFTVIKKIIKYNFSFIWPFR